jgi:next to BRCA1 gene 1 protein
LIYLLLMFQVKYNGTIKRFNACVNGSYLDRNLAFLRSKIESAFEFSSDVEFILTYTDEDGDLVMMDDDNDLCDAAINQKLNPLRINVQLKNSNVEAPRTKQQSSSSRSPKSAALEDQLAQVKSAIDEAMKFVPEQMPTVLANLSHDLRARTVSSVPSLAEFLERLATLMTPKCNMPTSNAPVYGSSGSFSVGPQASINTRIEHENELMTGSASASQHSDMRSAPGPKNVLQEDHKAQVEQAPLYHSVDSLNFTSSGGKKSDHEGSTIAESKGRCASQSKGKSTISSSVPAVSACTSVATPIQHTSAPSVAEDKLRCWPTYGSNGLIGGGSQSRRASSVLSPYHRHLGSSSYQYDWQPSFSSTNVYGPPKSDMPSSLGTYVPSKDGLYPIGNSYKYYVPSSVSSPEGRYSFGRSYNYGSTPQHVLHKWIQCDGCGVTPIVGPRYKSNV